MIWYYILVGLACLAIGAAIGYFYRKNEAEKKIGRTEQYAQRLLDDATRKADEQKKEMILAAKEEVLHLKSEADKEIRARRTGSRVRSPLSEKRMSTAIRRFILTGNTISSAEIPIRDRR